MAISDWPASERPREKLLELGPSALSPAELLAIFLRVGIKGKSAVDLARDLLQHFGSLSGLAHASIHDISQIAGMGTAKAVQLHAAIELARRALAETMSERDNLTSPQAVKDWLRLRLSHLQHEVFMVLLLNTQNQLIHQAELFRGTLTQASVYPREVVKLALQHNAAAAIFAHNHPSGTTTPSTSDLNLTQKLKDALSLVDIRVLDHFIIAPSQPPYSFVENGLLNCQ